MRWEKLDDKTNKALDQTSKIVCLAKRVTVAINDYTEADTFTCEFDYQNFPFDPRCIRSLGITIHMDDRKKTFKGNSLNTIEALSVSPLKEEDKPDSEKKSNIIFMGFADEESLSFDESDRIVSIEGRDYTSILIDAPWPRKVLDPVKRVDALISEMLKALPAAKDIIVLNKTGDNLPILKSYAPQLSNLSGNKNAKKNMSYWDMIKKLVSEAGLITYIELDSLVINKPRNLYKGTKSYSFIYGKNLQSLDFSRKLGRQKGINILVRAINTANKTDPVMKVEIPKEASKEWIKEMNLPKNKFGTYAQTIEKMDKDGKVTEEIAPLLPFNLTKIDNVNQLRTNGETIWEEIGRQQIEGSLKTKDMRQFQTVEYKKNKFREEEFNLLKIRNGTPIILTIDQGDMEGLEDETSIAKKTQFLKERGYQNDVALAFATTFKKFGSKFYTKLAEFTLDKEDGFTLKLEFLNFIDIVNKGKK